MDTRFWGPSGWRLLHLIAADSLSDCRKTAVKKWFGLLEYVLPCKYCRASFHDYMEIQPLTDFIISTPETFSRWLYDIHNRVNGKLRGQGLLTTPDPSWPSIHKFYKELHADLCKGSPLLGWDFMTSVAYTTPDRKTKSKPMPDYEDHGPLTYEKRNRYNLLTRAERLSAQSEWWALIPSILPCKAWRQAWNRGLEVAGPPPLQKGREAVMRWMWRVEESVCDGLKCPTPHSSLPALTEEVSAFESGCGSSKKGKTCRTRKHRQRRQVLSRRREH